MTTNFFSIFALPQSYAIDEKQLENSYRKLAASYHPDKFASLSSFEQKEKMIMSSLINQAYKVLSDPIQRASHLLLLNGINADARENNIADTEFLMQQLQWQETLEEAKHLTDIQDLSVQIQEVKTKTETQLNLEFEQHDFNAALKTFQKLRFIYKLSNDIKDKLSYATS